MVIHRYANTIVQEFAIHQISLVIPQDEKIV